MDEFRANRNAIILALAFAIGLIACAQLMCGAEPRPKDEVLFFHASWCGPCKAIEPSVRQLANERTVLREIDVDYESDIAERFRIRQVPTFVRIHNGKEEARLVGQVSVDRLRIFIHPKERKK